MADTAGLPNLDGLVDKFIEDFFEPTKLTRLQNTIRNAHAEGATVAAGAQVAATKQLAREENSWILEAIAKGLIAATDLPESLLDPIARGAIESLLQPEVVSRHGADNAGGRLIAKLSSGSSVEPGIEGAARYLTLFINESVEAWLRGVALEIVTEFCPTELVGIGGGIESMQKLQEVIEHALGGDRMVRRVLQPFISATAITPAQWHVNKLYTPQLLSESLAVREFLRGAYSREELEEELARQGWSAKRIEAHLNATARELSLGDTLQLVRHGRLDRGAAIVTLRAAGYDEAAAELALVAEESRRFDSYNDNPLGAITRAYVNRDITESEFRSFLPAIIVDDTDRTAYESGAAIERALNVKHLSHGEVIDCVLEKILSRVDYRRWLEREGYPPEEAAALELRLAKRLNEQADLEEERQRIADERAADKAAKAAAAAQRRTDVEAERALHRRGSLGDLERAAVRGLIPLARVEEVLTAQYDADTVAILLELVEGDRVAYVDAAARADEARKRAAVRHVDIGDLEQAVLANVLTLDEYRQGLRARGFDAADTQILTATLEAHKADVDDARAKRAAAESAAKTRSIDLGRFERLVRRGVRTFAQYDALLLSLGFDDGARAAMADLVRLEIADDEAARAERDRVAAASRVKGISLEQFRRAVLLGLESDDAFQSYLVKAGYTSDAQRLLLAELRRDVVDADAARRKREEAEAASAVVALPLSRLARAARLGLVSPAAYQARLAADGYTPDDIAIEMELLLVEIADERAAQARRDELAAALEEPKALTLQQIAQAVKAGTQSINDYRFALAQVYDQNDVEVLARTLQAELDTLNDAAGRRVTIEGELAARTLSIGDLEAGVKSGLVSFEQYRDQLIRWGYGADDAELLTALLVEKLHAAPAGDDGG
jgi:hypothetical protein